MFTKVIENYFMILIFTKNELATLFTSSEICNLKLMNK